MARYNASLANAGTPFWNSLTLENLCAASPRAKIHATKLCCAVTGIQKFSIRFRRLYPDSALVLTIWPVLGGGFSAWRCGVNWWIAQAPVKHFYDANMAGSHHKALVVRVKNPAASGRYAPQRLGLPTQNLKIACPKPMWTILTNRSTGQKPKVMVHWLYSGHAFGWRWIRSWQRVRSKERCRGLNGLQNKRNGGVYALVHVTQRRYPCWAKQSLNTMVDCSGLLEGSEDTRFRIARHWRTLCASMKLAFLPGLKMAWRS